MHYWKTHQKKLIFHFLEIYATDKKSFMLWQQIGSTRKQYQAYFQEVSKQRCKVRINKDSIKETGDLDKTLPIYIHLPNIDVIFKKDQHNIYMDQLDFPPPGEIQVYEKRVKERFYYLYQDHKNITFDTETNRPTD